MRILEFEGKAGPALAIVVTPQSVEAFEHDLREVEQALLDWRATRGACTLLTFTVVSPPGIHDVVETRFREVYDGDDGLSPLLGAMNVKLMLLDGQGRTVKEIEYPRRQGARPWWRFW